MQIDIDKVLEMIGKDREYEHKETCICQNCNRCWGINRTKDNLRRELEDYKNNHKENKEWCESCHATLPPSRRK